MDAQDYIDELKAKKRRNLIIGVAVAVILAIIMLPRFFSGGDALPDLDTALARTPELALTEAEIGLADTLLEPDTFRKELTYDALTVTTFELAEVQDLIAPVLPTDAEILEIAVQGAVVCIDYRTEGLRTILEYVDADRSGAIDQIRKTVAVEESREEPLVPESQNVCTIQYTVATGETKVVAYHDLS